MKDDLFYLPVKIGGVEFKNPLCGLRPDGEMAQPAGTGGARGLAAASIKQTFNPIPILILSPDTVA